MLIPQAQWAHEGVWPWSAVVDKWMPDMDRVSKFDTSLLGLPVPVRQADSTIHSWDHGGLRHTQRVRFCSSVGATQSDAIVALASEVRRGIVCGDGSDGDPDNGPTSHPIGLLAQLRAAGRTNAWHGPLTRKQELVINEEITDGCDGALVEATKIAVLSARMDWNARQECKVYGVHVPEMPPDTVIIGRIGRPTVEVGSLMALATDTKPRGPTSPTDTSYLEPPTTPAPIAACWYGSVAVYRPEQFVVLEGCTGFAP